ncbi:DUF5954 family protein [Kitasatospora sp. NPDC001261]|uniref:DUF5954 family protein n=1 Tax=Kitasatospora sp. NPDC001261 TaxID=3364012 RepID=UPI0036D005DE
MVNFPDDVPGYLSIRMAAPTEPVAGMADVEAWTARDSYPQILSAGSRAFGVARELPTGGWALRTSMAEVYPQSARDDLGMVCREQAGRAERAGDTAAQQRYLAAAGRLEWEKLDEVELDVRYRVVRAERYIRSGPDGPEPPRSTDPDDHRKRPLAEALDPAAGFVMDPALPTGLSTGILKTDLIQLVPTARDFPPEVRRDALRSSTTHPGVVLLPAAFGVAERVDGRWRPVGVMDAPTPFRARDILSMRLRVTEPVERRLSDRQRARYAEAADRLEAEQGFELTVEDRLLRIIRVERAVRFGPDGPEGPRPSDHDPEDPILVMDQKLRAQGIVPDEDDDEPIVLDESAREFQRLFEAEMARRGTPLPRFEDDGA